jgi:hypothetical protein
MYCGDGHLGFPIDIKNIHMAAIVIHRLTLDPMGKCSNAFFSETTNMIKAKLYMNNIFPKGPMLIYVLWWRPSLISDRHKKHKFSSGPSNDHSWAVWFQLFKWFQRSVWTLWKNVQMSSSQKLQILLKPNCTWMFIGWSSTNFTFFVPIRPEQKT